MRPNKILNFLSIKDILELVNYDSSTGSFHSAKNTHIRKKGEVIGSNNNGYIRIFLSGRYFPAHRLAWIIHYGAEPNGLIDHINGVKNDNRISNLREVDVSQNAINSKIKSDNKSGCKAVFWNKRKSRWYVTPRLDGKKIYLGSFINKQDAINAYCEFSRKHHGEYRRIN